MVPTEVGRIWAGIRAIPKVKAFLVGLVLALHFLTRLHTAQTMPREARQFYSRNYEVALSLIAGRGFDTLPLGETDEARPIREFLSLKRDHVSHQEFEAYVNSLKTRNQEGAFQVPTQIRVIETTGRILDLRLAAALWWLFGIGWPVLFTFYCILSMLACLLLFLMARQLAENYWAGLAAAVLLLASPLENQFCVRSIRDVNPLWFMTLGFFVLFRVVGRLRSPRMRGIGYVVSGIAAMIGYGWRADALLLPPYLAVCLAVYLLCRGYGWRHTGLALLLFAVGTCTTRSAILAVGPRQELSTGVAFHMAYYGHAIRCNLLGVENSFEAVRDDRETCIQAQFYAEMNHGKAPEFCSREHGRTCTEMYVETLGYDAANWTRYFPKFYRLAMQAFPEPGHLQGEWRPALDQSRLPWLKPVYRLFLDPLTMALPFLFAVGFLTAVLFSREKVCVTGVGVFSVYYAAALFLVLPERKHLAPLLLPLCVLGGMGLCAAARLLQPALLLADLRAVSPARLKTCACVVGTVLVGWFAAFLLASEYSAAQRQRYINTVMGAARSGVDASTGIKSGKVFSVRSSSLSPQEHAGYLLKLFSGDGPGTLSCMHQHERHDDWWWGMRCTTRHALQPQRVQYFYFSFVNGAKYGDPRPYTCTVMIEGDATILSARRLDVSQWKGLPFSTVFSYGDNVPGSPRAPEGQASTETSSVGQLSALGIPLGMCYGDLEPMRKWALSAAFEKGSPALLVPAPSPEPAPSPALPLGRWAVEAQGASINREQDGVAVTTPPGRYAYAAAYAPLSVAEDGEYLFRLQHQLLSGGMMFGALSQDKSAWIAQAPATTGNTSYLRVSLKAGSSLHLLLTNLHPQGDISSSFVIKHLEVQCEQLPGLPWQLRVSFDASGHGVIARGLAGDVLLPADHWSPAVGGVNIATKRGEVTVSTLPGQHAYAAAYAPLRVPEDGSYVLVLRCQVISGGFSFGALSADQSRWLAQAGAPSMQARDRLSVLAVTLKAGDVLRPLVTNNHPAGDFPSRLVIKELRCYEDRVPRWRQE